MAGGDAAPLPGFHAVFETITFWIIVAWFIAGVWMIMASFGGPATAGRSRPSARVNSAAETP
jgi:hypothetical protein